MKLTIAIILFLASFRSYGESNLYVNGRSFKVLATQHIRFVPLKKIDQKLYDNPTLPRKVDLRSIQSKVKAQGMRGACTYFVITSLIESLIKKATNKEVSLSEEYLAWAAKTKKKLRSLEEDSSVAVNAATIQDFGFMLEADMPYQQSWFDPGMLCEHQKGKTNIDPICYSHAGPKDLGKIFSGTNFEFRDIGSSSIEVVQEMAKSRVPITVSIFAHPKMWKAPKKTGDLYLDEISKKECQRNPKACSGHAALIVGYDLDKKIFIFKNSWGDEWGQQGYGTIPFDYMDQMSDRRLLIGHLIGSVDLPK